MSKFPVEISDGEGIVDAVNYLLAGPAGLGQNFGGVSFSEQGYMTGSNTDPYFKPTTTVLQSAQINIDTGEFLDGITLKITFAGAPLGYVPFNTGDPVYLVGSSETLVNGYYNVGVVECTNSYVILRDPTAAVPTPGPFTGGYLEKIVTDISYFADISGAWHPTDCNSFATVTSETDKVFISAQSNFDVHYTVLSGGPYQLNVNIAVNRYKAISGQPTINPKINFAFDKVVSKQSYGFPGITTTGSTGLQLGPVFSPVIDSPGPGYYWYVLEVQFDRNGSSGSIYVDSFSSIVRSLATQVVKQ